ncbi:gluconate 2-dehydrogenase subunit 3-like protein [Roseiarcus fermentans]|uniref:Gluconate 2-dehydrogenase subunit 3-like protein n=1 Tax=Roseiarcus fermentans TaxID=1473586 RepID=A0A366EKG2_9HYPH|nr:gluconate 2-dehydrogenase subunit 3 family protein [Roseiarcus fermentans]RBP02824.1 gluconate 2-dehydrogenase subunit 3-like protein [Roseiarcus fermentans]
MRERYPGYDVLAKRDTPSWNDQTRRAIDARMAIPLAARRFFSDDEWPTVQAICGRIVPQPRDRARPAPVAAMIDAKLAADDRDGYRHASMPPQREAWRRGVRAIDAEAQARLGARFHALAPDAQDEVLKAAQRGEARSDAWGDMPPAEFFRARLLHDVLGAYYAHPSAWSEIGFGGPASPRGYVRMNFDRRDPWEAAEALPGREADARRDNASVR